MSLDGAVSGADPVCLNLLGQIIQVSNAFHEPGSFFNYRSPGSPDDRFAAAGRGNRQKLPESQQVFMMKSFIAKKIHVVRSCRTLCIYIKHQPAVKSVRGRNSCNGLQSRIQIVRFSCRRIDSDADHRLLSARTKNITVFHVEIRNIQPNISVIHIRSAFFFCFRKAQDIHLICL